MYLNKNTRLFSYNSGLFIPQPLKRLSLNTFFHST